MALLSMMVFGLLLLIWHQQLFVWLDNHSLEPPEGWRRPETLVRSGEEWEGLYLSNGMGIERMLWLAGCDVFALVAVQAMTRYLNICQGIDMLDPLVLDMTARDRRWFARDCDSAGFMFAAANGCVAFAVFLRRQSLLQWRSGRAVLARAT